MLLAAMPEKPRPRKNKSKLSASVGRLDSRNSFMEIMSFLFVSFLFQIGLFQIGSVLSVGVYNYTFLAGLVWGGGNLKY